MPKKFHIGMRTIKTGLSVAIVTVLYQILLPGGSAQIAALSSVFSQRANFNDTINFARFRAVGNTIGGLVALFCVFLSDFLSLSEPLNDLLPALGIILTIVLSNALNDSQAIVGACATFLIIIFNIPGDNRYSYSIYRILDTFLGALVAIFVEFTLPRQRVNNWRQKFHAYAHKK